MYIRKPTMYICIIYIMIMCTFIIHKPTICVYLVFIIIFPDGVPFVVIIVIIIIPSDGMPLTAIIIIIPSNHHHLHF